MQYAHVNIEYYVILTHPFSENIVLKDCYKRINAGVALLAKDNVVRNLGGMDRPITEWSPELLEFVEERLQLYIPDFKELEKEYLFGSVAREGYIRNSIISKLGHIELLTYESACKFRLTILTERLTVIDKMDDKLLLVSGALTLQEIKEQYHQVSLFSINNIQAFVDYCIVV